LDKHQNGLTAKNRKEAFSLWPRGQHRFFCLNQAKHLDFTDSIGADRRTTPSQEGSADHTHPAPIPQNGPEAEKIEHCLSPADLWSVQATALKDRVFRGLQTATSIPPAGGPA
jgi:hypothetical protein